MSGSRHRLRRRLLLIALIGAALTAPLPAAQAACHAFTVSATPTTVDEGASITVTVSRDAAVNPSSVDVRTVDGTARSGQDFTGGRRTITFTSETSKSYSIPTIKDGTPEPAESFRVELVPGSGSGCAVNPSFTYGPPVTLTIRADQRPAASPVPTPRPPSPTRQPTAPATRQPARSATPGSASPAAGPASTGAPSPTPAVATPAASAPGDGTTPAPAAPAGRSAGLRPGMAVAVLLLLAAAVAVGTALRRRRRPPGA